MYSLIEKSVFTETIKFLEYAITRKQLLAEIGMSHQWLYDNLEKTHVLPSGQECTKLKRNTWQQIKAIALRELGKQTPLLDALKKY